MAERDFLTYAIGDVHGCLDKLLWLLEFCDRHRGELPARFVFLGDYIDRGPDSCGTVSALMQLQRSRPSEVRCLCGNHETMMLDAVGYERNDRLHWKAQGGAETLESYGVDSADEVPLDHCNWIGSLPLLFYRGLRFFLPAGVNPGA